MGTYILDCRDCIETFGSIKPSLDFFTCCLEHASEINIFRSYFSNSRLFNDIQKTKSFSAFELQKFSFLFMKKQPREKGQGEKPLTLSGT